MSVMDICKPLADELKELEEQGIEAYDVALQEKVLVVAPVIICFICDNPHHSEIMNHLGPTAVKYCRMCMVRQYLLYYSVLWRSME